MTTAPISRTAEIGGGLDEAQLKSLLDAGVITQEQYDTLLELLTGSGDAA